MVRELATAPRPAPSRRSREILARPIQRRVPAGKHIVNPDLRAYLGRDARLHELRPVGEGVAGHRHAQLPVTG